MPRLVAPLIGTFVVALSVMGDVRGAEPPLHAEVDRLLEADSLAPASPLCDDAEFVRRVYLDLHGIIPSVAEAREFLDDRAAEKRTKLVDRLLASPRFARHMANVFDVMWMERRPEKVVKFADWYEFLYKSFLDGKPYDQLVREVLTANDADPALKPASKFFHDRDCEPNTLTRDIGRFFFGMDMQCNQCHDHPVIDDYSIGDYYGLYAFVGRTYLFNDPKTRAKVIAEKAEGEASFKSVFTGEAADKVTPRLPRGAAMVEPVFAKGEEYLTKPDKKTMGVPKFSRRAKFAEMATDGKNAMFDRNAVNRLWAHLFGRGLVHPVDFMHPANPPSHPAVLDLLAVRFHDGGYDVRPILRELALTRAYQRSCQVPSAEGLKVGEAARRLPTLEAAEKKLTAEVALAAETLKQATAKAKDAKAPADATSKRDTAAAELRRLQTLLTAATRKLEEARQVVEFERLAKSDPKGAKQAWEALVLRWSDQCDLANLKPLSPEAFTMSLLQASGQVAISEAKPKAALAKSPPKEVAEAKPADRERVAAVFVDRQTFEPLRSNVARFVDLYGGEPGADFAATLNQALFFGNGGIVDGWIKPSRGNLAERVDKLSDAAGAAEELYLTALTRRPTDEERLAVAEYLKPRTKDRSVAVQEMIWALLSSNEFRFNH